MRESNGMKRKTCTHIYLRCVFHLAELLVLTALRSVPITFHAEKKAAFARGRSSSFYVLRFTFHVLRFTFHALQSPHGY